jgi:hypothetical protein
MVCAELLYTKSRCGCLDLLYSNLRYLCHFLYHHNKQQPDIHSGQLYLSVPSHIRPYPTTAQSIVIMVVAARVNLRQYAHSEPAP